MGETCSTYRDRRGAYKVLVGKTGERDNLEDTGIDGKFA
jgi:hypothetical protein